MADSFGELEDREEIEKSIGESLHAKNEIDKVFLNCYNTPEGKRMIELLHERHVDVPIYAKGMTLDEVAYRQGQCDSVLSIEKSVFDALTPIQA